ncbi:MAG: hypothetical protein Fur0025_00470 [Oscillatoriaceae cyanobacterium]
MPALSLLWTRPEEADNLGGNTIPITPQMGLALVNSVVGLMVGRIGDSFHLRSTRESFIA